MKKNYDYLKETLTDSICEAREKIYNYEKENLQNKKEYRNNPDALKIKIGIIEDGINYERSQIKKLQGFLNVINKEEKNNTTYDLLKFDLEIAIEETEKEIAEYNKIKQNTLRIYKENPQKLEMRLNTINTCIADEENKLIKYRHLLNLIDKERALAAEKKKKPAKKEDCLNV